MLFDFAEDCMFALLGLAVYRLTNAAAPGWSLVRVRNRYESALRMLHELLGQVLINALTEKARRREFSFWQTDY